MPATRICLVAVLACCLALLRGAVSAKVTFPETPRSAARVGDNPLPPAAAPAESRLLADAGGVFGVTTSASPSAPLSSASGAQTRNLDGASVLGLARRRPDCPDCHPTVFRYCSDLLLHDACCCLRESQPLPPQCQLADCSFLHAKSCYEHALITRCCCDRRLF